MRILLLLFFGVIVLVVGIAAAHAQALKSGFDADEYIGVLQRCALQVDKEYRGHLPAEMTFERIYRSPARGLHNRFDLWLSKDKQVIAINLRGTTANLDSWVENFYSAMVPAAGSFNFGGAPFNYKFTADTRAKVHVGWALGACSLLPEMITEIKGWYGRGVRQFIVEGHSQGGALAFLVSSYMHYLVVDGGLPRDITIKTYCSAAPKPGNMYYAYDFDYITRGGWAYTVVSTLDWVPEMPVTVQTRNDLNNDPFADAKEQIKKQRFWVRYYVKHMYKAMDKSTRKAQKKYEKFLGRVMYRQVKRYAQDLQQPDYARCSNYMRAGNPIVLQPDSAYARIFPDTGSNIFRHHLFDPYYYLVRKTYK